MTIRSVLVFTHVVRSFAATSRRWSQLTIVAAFVCLTASSALAAGSVTRLVAASPPLIKGVSGNGAIVVGAVGAFPTNPYSWLSSTGSATLLPSVGTWGPLAEATGVNSTGSLISGYDYGDFAIEQAVVFDGGVRYVLSSTGTASAWGISGDGTTVVGRSGADAVTWTGNWSTGGTRTSLPGFYQTGSARALGANGDGSVIIGSENDPLSDDRSVIWVKTGGSYSVQNVPGVGGDFDKLNKVSSDGQVVVGYSLDASELYRAFRWTRAGGTQDLGNLPGAGASAENEAWGANSDGSIIVGFGDDSLGNDRAFRWTQASGLVDLNLWLPNQGVDLTGWTLEKAYVISDDGGIMAGSGRFNGAPAGWVVTVTAVPEPGAVGLAATGLAAACFGVWRRRRQVGRRDCGA